MVVNELDALDWKEILNKLESFATSDRARVKLSNLVPLASPQEALDSVSEIQEASMILSHGERPFMESLDFFSPWFQRLKREAVLTTLELKDVRRFCLETLALSEVLRPLEGSLVLSLKTKIMDAAAPLSAIDTLMTPEGEIRSDASENLYNLYREKNSQTRLLQTTLDKIVHKHQMESVLQDKYVTTREGRWVLPVRGGMQHQFPGIIHASSQSKQTVFMEPEEVIPLNNRLRQLDVEIEAEIERLLIALSQYLQTQLSDFQMTSEALLNADIRLAQAKLADTLQAQPCRFSENQIELNEVRHPLLVLKTEKVIANSVKLSTDKRILLLSGPNAGGKTVLLKSVGLAAQMARCGLPICADEGSVLPFFTNIQVAVGDAQSVDAQLSTFAAHLKILNAATLLKPQNPTSSSPNLLLIDEICGSTDPEEGAALARSFIETYSKNGVFAVITSHLGPLKVGWSVDSGVTNGSLEYNSHSGQPTYQFFMGIPGQSLALQTAKRVGVSETIINRAMDFLSPEAKLQHQHLREIESLKDELQELRQNLQAEAKEVRDSKRKYQELIQKFRAEKDEWLGRTVKKAEKKIDNLLELAQVDSVFKKHEKLSQIRHELPEVVKASTVQPLVRRKVESAEDFEKIYPPGSKVFIPSIAQEGVIQGKANSKGELPVLSHSMRLFVHWQQLKPPQNSVNPTAQIVRRSSTVTVSLSDSERVIDLRGFTVDEAISQLESQLDAASVAQEDRVKIIHGHGTEALKRAVRSYLSRSVYVKKWKAAAEVGGGDGLTWAELKDS
jgi:DNA mismatch repair protein MutS2